MGPREGLPAEGPARGPQPGSIASRKPPSSMAELWGARLDPSVGSPQCAGSGLWVSPGDPAWASVGATRQHLLVLPGLCSQHGHVDSVSAGWDWEAVRHSLHWPLGPRDVGRPQAGAGQEAVCRVPAPPSRMCFSCSLGCLALPHNPGSPFLLGLRWVGFCQLQLQRIGIWPQVHSLTGTPRAAWQCKVCRPAQFP